MNSFDWQSLGLALFCLVALIVFGSIGMIQ